MVDAVSFSVVGVGVSEEDGAEGVEEGVTVEVVAGAVELMVLDELELRVDDNDRTAELDATEEGDKLEADTTKEDG